MKTSFKQIWVLKAGTSLVSGKNKGIDNYFISNLALQIDYLRKKKIGIILVTSGAVAKGMYELNLEKRPESLHLLQASAAVGQIRLIEAYQKAFDEYKIKAAQVLISHDDIANRKRYLNARMSLQTLVSLGTVPIVNENDSVAVEEISYGDNDRLGAAIASLIGAQKFLMLTDQEGILSEDPKINKEAKLLSFINFNDDKLDLTSFMSSKAGIEGRGGMKTKLEAARIALNSGSEARVIDGRNKNILIEFYSGKEVGTNFLTNKSTLQSRKVWISSFGSSQGILEIDEGACLALKENGKSLLAAGIVSLEGEFNRGSLITCKDSSGIEIAKGLVNFSSQEIKEIKGINSADIPAVLGYVSNQEVIHRDNLVLS